MIPTHLIVVELDMAEARPTSWNMMIVLISYPAMVFSLCLLVDLLFGAKV